MVKPNTVSLKLPQFWADESKIWFAQVEGQFALKNVTSETHKYHPVLASLKNEIAITLTDFFEKVPAENPYTALKLRLLKKYTYTDLEKAEMVPSMPGLGDRKPSSLLDSMLALCPAGQEASPLFLSEFLHRMPAVVNEHLHTFSHEDSRALAQHTDQVWSSHAPQTVHQVLDDKPDFYTDFFSCNTINQPTMIKKDNSSRNQRNSSTFSVSQMCFYHEKYGKKARKCTRPCSFQSQYQMGNGHTGGRR